MRFSPNLSASALLAWVLTIPEPPDPSKIESGIDKFFNGLSSFFHTLQTICIILLAIIVLIIVLYVLTKLFGSGGRG